MSKTCFEEDASIPFQVFFYVKPKAYTKMLFFRGFVLWFSGAGLCGIFYKEKVALLMSTPLEIVSTT